MHSNTFQARFLAFCREYSLLKTDSILVAFSGGSDSAVLLTLLHKECQRRKIRLGALHVNHMIRADEATADEAFCFAFCEKRRIPFFSVSINVPSLAQKNKTGMEETARNERYRILNEYATKEGFSRIATAHNATDNLETLIFHLTRGTSVHGAGGIHPIRGNVIRPLLPFSKEEIQTFATENAIPFVVDSTNSDTTYTRNFIRHKIIPQLRLINPAVEASALRFTKAARLDDEALLLVANQYEDCSNTEILASLDTAILSRVLLIKYSRIANNELSEKHILAMVAKIRTANSSGFCGELSLPGKITARITPARFSLEENCPKTLVVPLPQSLHRDGCDIVFADRYRIKLCDGKDVLTQSNTLLAYANINPNSIMGQLYVRTRREGDSYVVGKMTRKLKKMLCDYKIDPDIRTTWPLICDSEGILFVPHLPLADRAKPCEQEEQNTVRIEIHIL